MSTAAVIGRDEEQRAIASFDRAARPLDALVVSGGARIDFGRVLSHRSTKAEATVRVRSRLEA